MYKEAKTINVDLSDVKIAKLTLPNNDVIDFVAEGRKTYTANINGTYNVVLEDKNGNHVEFKFSIEIP